MCVVYGIWDSTYTVWCNAVRGPLGHGGQSPHESTTCRTGDDIEVLDYYDDGYDYYDDDDANDSKDDDDGEEEDDTIWQILKKGPCCAGF